MIWNIWINENIYFIRLNLHWQINHIYDTHKYILFYLTNIWIEKKLIKKYKDTFCPLTNFDFCWKNNNILVLIS